ncbi:MAG TPA: hypothetical protein VLW75_08075 [Rhizomicrobium sp.]|nr:hypothetical protein [Rhizomicrobium sp.]
MADIIPELQKLRHQAMRLGAAAKASHHPEIKLAFEIAMTKLQERAAELEAQLAAGEARAG